jgi:two-component system, NarL family, nitrate/nitrite response regulator NarL
MNIPTRILLVDDHGLFRESLVRLLESEADLSVVAHCESTAEAMKVIERGSVDVVLLDYDLGNERGTDLIARMKAAQDPPRILIVTAGMSDRITRDVLSAGVGGVLHKHSSPIQLVAAIRKVAQGHLWLEDSIIRSLAAGTRAESAEMQSTRPLTQRQREVLSGILDGLTNKEIAWKLKVSESSIKAVIQELFHKAGVRTRSQLVRIAVEKHATDWLSNDKASSL